MSNDIGSRNGTQHESKSFQIQDLVPDSTQYSSSQSNSDERLIIQTHSANQPSSSSLECQPSSPPLNEYQLQANDQNARNSDYPTQSLKKARRPRRKQDERIQSLKRLYGDDCTSQCNNLIYEAKEPLLGLEYCIEILNPDLKKPPFYNCVLCKFKLNITSVVQHFASPNHGTKYIQKHFPSLDKHLNGIVRFREDNDYRSAVLREISAKIEDKFGRPTAYIHEGTDFEAKKKFVYVKVEQRKHIDEDDIQDCVEVLVRDIDFDNIQFAKFQSQLNKLKIDVYTKKCKVVTDELEKKYEEHKKNPDYHPLYNREWDDFWLRKCNELGNYIKVSDVIVEWSNYFAMKMDELHKEELTSKKESIRMELELSQSDIQSEQLDDTQSIDNSYAEVVNDERNSDFNRSRREAPKRVHSNDSEEYRHQSNEKFDGNLNKHSKRIHQSQNTSPNSKLIPTLRILSTLETELGLIAPKVLELLSRALAAEREKPSSSEELLFHPEVFNIIELAKEKLLGLQAMDLIPAIKERAATTAIEDITKLLEQQEKLENYRNSVPRDVMRWKESNDMQLQLC